jgi:putative Mn2+ efflux pump MntP
MNKLFDLRFVIGSFFSIVGLLLLIYSFAGSNLAEQDQNINRWCGVIFIVFGVIMIILSLQKEAHDEILEDEGRKHGAH